MFSLLLEAENLPTAAELRRYEMNQMHVNLEPADTHSPLTAISLCLAGPHALDNSQRFVEEHDTMRGEFVLTTAFG